MTVTIWSVSTIEAKFPAFSSTPVFHLPLIFSRKTLFFWRFEFRTFFWIWSRDMRRHLAMVKNQKFQKMPKISLGRKPLFLEFPKRSQNAIVHFLQCFVIGMGASSFTMFSEGAPNISSHCVSWVRAKHQFLLRFLRGARNIGPIGSTRVGLRWVDHVRAA